MNFIARKVRWAAGSLEQMLPDSDIHYKSGSSFKWAVFTLQLGSISCGVPAAHSPSPTYSSEKCGLRQELATLLRAHSLSCGWRAAMATLVHPPWDKKKKLFFLSPCTTQTVGVKHLTAKAPAQQQYICFNFLLVTAKSTNTDELSGVSPQRGSGHVEENSWSVFLQDKHEILSKQKDVLMLCAAAQHMLLRFPTTHEKWQKQEICLDSRRILIV